MPLWKSLLLHAYYAGSLPLRWSLRRNWTARGKAPIGILYYHCATERSPAPWMMSNQQFIDQIKWLQKNFEIITLGEAQRRLRAQRNDRPAVVLTFDDGYAENCLQALPYLIKEKIPCTYFVTLDNIVEGVPFEHDLASGFDFAPNSLEQIRAISAAGIEIGAHTRTHCDLGKVHDPEMLYEELVYVRTELQNLLNVPINYFSFPFGQRSNMSDAAFSYAAKAGYAGVCSAYGALNFPGDDAFHLRRIPATAELICVKNWLTADPRKIAIPCFDYTIDEDIVAGEAPNTIEHALPA